MSKILVTGGSGFIGSNLVKALLLAGHEIRVLDNNSRGKKDRLSNDIHFIAGDIRDADAVAAATKGMDEVHHLAFINGTKTFYTDPELVLNVGVCGMVNVLDSCRRHNINTLLLVSSSEVYQTPPRIPTNEAVPLSIPDPHNPRYSYAAGKIISEMLALHSVTQSRVVIVRPHNIYGPDMGDEHVIPQLIRRVLAEGTLEFQGEVPPFEWGDRRVFWGGDQTRAFCYITDAVAGLMIARERGEHRNIYNLGTTREVSIVNLARRIAKMTGCEIKVTGHQASDGGPLRRCPDITKLAALGYSPRISLDEGLERTVTWYIQ